MSVSRGFSLHVELVPFRIEHGNAVLAIFVGAGRNKGGASPDQTFDRPVEAGAPSGVARSHAVQVLTAAIQRMVSLVV
jgi:hypothetical protein